MARRDYPIDILDSYRREFDQMVTDISVKGEEQFLARRFIVRPGGWNDAKLESFMDWWEIDFVNRIETGPRGNADDAQTVFKKVWAFSRARAAGTFEDRGKRALFLRNLRGYMYDMDYLRSVLARGLEWAEVEFLEAPPPDSSPLVPKFERMEVRQIAGPAPPVQPY